jgi:electron transfer flavoprotein alpha subunit
MTRALVVVEPGLDPASSVGLARGVVEDVTVLSLANSGTSPAIVSSADSMVAVVGDRLEIAEVAAGVIAEVVERCGVTLVVLPTTARFREVFPLLTYRLGAAGVSDVLALRRNDGELEADRLLYGGVAVATMGLARPTAVVTAPAARCEIGAGDLPEVLDVPISTLASKAVVSRQTVVSEVALPSAERLVSFGRGLRSHADIALIERLAQLLSAEIGCSRPIVEDMRWLSVDHQVGLTGTTVTPNLYLAVGISGQIQHLVGMRDSKVIVAINSNPAAPIFSVADIGIVGDLYEVVPRLIDALAAKAG